MVPEKVFEPVSEKLGTEKLPISVSKKFGTGKSIGIGIIQNFGYRHTLIRRWVDLIYIFFPPSRYIRVGRRIEHLVRVNPDLYLFTPLNCSLSYGETLEVALTKGNQECS